jgi:hypothetical protein
MTNPSWIKLYKEELKFLSNHFKSNECVLFLHYRSIMDWDERHKNFGTAKKTIREMKRDQLPSWSIGKIWMVRKRLIQKKLLIKMADNRYQVAENKFQFTEKAIRDPEKNVREDEEDKIDKTKQEISDHLDNKGLLKKKRNEF